MNGSRSRKLAAAWAVIISAVAFSTPAVAQESALHVAFEEAAALFNSALQPDSIPAFTVLIRQLEGLDARQQLDAELRLLLSSCFYYRARAFLNLGDEEAADADLRGLVEYNPGFEPERQLVSPKLLELFDAIHSETVGYLLLMFSPDDAIAKLDGREVHLLFELTGLLAGTYELTVQRPGFAPYQETLEIAAGATEQRDVVLVRSSAVVTLVTRPPGAEILVDDRAIGVTSGTAPSDRRMTGVAAGFPNREFSAPIVIDGLLPGPHMIEVKLEGYREFATTVEVTDLRDFDAGGFVLEPLQGTIVLRGLPDGATVLINDIIAETRPGGAEDSSGNTPAEPFVELAPGEYRVTAREPTAGVYEASISVMDRGLHNLDVKLRPSIVFLGVIGDDEVGATEVVAGLRERMGGVERWAFLERPAEDVEALGSLGVTAATLRQLSELASPHDGAVDWSAVQTLTDERYTGSVYLLAALSDDLLATHVDLWLWPAAPGPSTPDRIRVPLDDPESLSRFVEQLEMPFSGTRPWFGALLLDSGSADRPLVFDVTPGGPAGEAGIQIGDVIQAVNGAPYPRAASIWDLIEASRPGDSLTIEVRRRAGPTTVTVRLGESPRVIGPGDPSQAYAAVWAAGLATAHGDDAAISGWVADLNVAGVLMQAGNWDAAVRRLRAIRVTDGDPNGLAMVDYYLGISLESIGPQYLERAREALSRAAAVDGARLGHLDGPYLAPRALARLQRMGGPIAQD